MWKAQRNFVPKDLVPVFADKQKFRQVFNDIMGYNELALTENISEKSILSWLLNNQITEVFVKPASGQCGEGAVRITETDFAKLAGQLKSRFAIGTYIVQPCLVNHPILKEVAPESLNTVRVVTKINKLGGADVLFARVRFGLDGEVDNLAAGGLAAVVDVSSGIVVSDAIVTNTIISPTRKTHPISQTVIKGIQVPYWDQVIKLSKQAALVCPRAKVIGWDIAVTEVGPVLLEGNHNWCKNLWQLPVGKGKRKELDKLVCELSK